MPLVLCLLLVGVVLFPLVCLVLLPIKLLHEWSQPPASSDPQPNELALLEHMTPGYTNKWTTRDANGKLVWRDKPHYEPPPEEKPKKTCHRRYLFIDEEIDPGDPGGGTFNLEGGEVDLEVAPTPGPTKLRRVK